MTTSASPIEGVPTHIVTGFLGVGKTTSILNLLAQKPPEEKWAVLVNEFGEIGVDGHLLAGQNLAKNEIAIKEVPGGCMCCASGLPMQIALNQLLAFAKPTRLFIEPTGLGHPTEVIQALSADHYQNVLDLRCIVTLVDPRKIRDERYMRHPTFREQLDIADIVVANKTDLAQPEDLAALKDFLAQLRQRPYELIETSHGDLNLEQLIGPSTQTTAPAPVHRDTHRHTHDHEHEHEHGNGHEHNHDHAREGRPDALASEQPLTPQGFLSSDNEGEGFRSIGWRFGSEIVFDRSRLLAFLSGLEVERLKAVFITDEGILAFNLADGVLTESMIDETLESRAEIIATDCSPDWETALLACRTT